MESFGQIPSKKHIEVSTEIILHACATYDRDVGPRNVSFGAFVVRTSERGHPAGCAARRTAGPHVSTTPIGSCDTMLFVHLDVEQVLCKYGIKDTNGKKDHEVVGLHRALNHGRGLQDWKSLWVRHA